MGRFAIASMFFHEYQTDHIFDFVAESGLNGIEFWVETPHFWLADRPEGLLQECVRNHPELAPVTVHAPILDLNPCSINPAVAEASVAYTIEAIELAERIGADIVTVHPGRRTAKRVPSGYDYERFERYMAAMQDAASKKRVKVAIENMEPKINSLLCTPESAREVLDSEPWLFFTLDMGHAMMRSPAEVTRYLDLCLDRMVNVHVGAVQNGSAHYPIHGDHEAAGALEALADRGYRGYLTLELEDRHFDQELSSEEKVTLVMQEAEVLRNTFS